MILFKPLCILALCATIPFGLIVSSSCNSLPKNTQWRTKQFVICYFFFKDSKCLSAAGSLSIGISPSLWFKSQEEDTPPFPSQENNRKNKIFSKHEVNPCARKPSTFLQLILKVPSGGCQATRWKWLPEATLLSSKSQPLLPTEGANGTQIFGGSCSLR